MTLGQRLKTYREKEGLTQEQLAEYLNVSRQAVTKWEHDAGIPDIENLVAISRRMGVTLDELVLGQTAGTAAPSVAPVASNAAPDAAPVIPNAAPGAAPVTTNAAISPNVALAAPGAAPVIPNAAPTAPATAHRSASARRHAFAALALFAACICHSIAGFVNLAALSTLHAPFLPLLNFGTAALSLRAAAVQARKCSALRQDG